MHQNEIVIYTQSDYSLPLKVGINYWIISGN